MRSHSTAVRVLQLQLLCATALVLLAPAAEVQVRAAPVVLALEDANAAVEFGTVNPADASIKRTAAAELTVTGKMRFSGGARFDAGAVDVYAPTNVYSVPKLWAGASVPHYFVADNSGGVIINVVPGNMYVVPFVRALPLQYAGITYWNSNNQEFKTAVAGIYHVCAAVRWTGIPGLDAALYFQHAADTTEVLFTVSGSTLGRYMSTCGDVYLTAGEWIRAVVWLDPSAPGNAIDWDRRRFSMRLVTVL